MLLQLYINNHLIGSLPLDEAQCKEPKYIVKKQQELEDKYRELIKETGAVPIFHLLEEKAL